MSVLLHQPPTQTAVSSEAARPFIKWAGGKRQLLPTLLRFVPSQYGTYYEPFLGGGALFFALRPQRAVLSDLNERLVRTYTGVATDVEGVIDVLSRWPHNRDFFDRLRKSDTSQMSDAEVAAWLIYLNRTCFNGLYRVNRHNQFNVPFGNYVGRTICDRDALRACSAALRGAVDLKTADFETALSGVRAGDLVYFDPPYVPVSEHSNFARYTSAVFSAEDQLRLRNLALRLKRQGVNVLLSNSSAPAVYELYGREFEIYTVDAKRSVNCKADGRGLVTEVIIR